MCFFSFLTATATVKTTAYSLVYPCPGSVEFFVNEITNTLKDMHRKPGRAEPRPLQGMLLEGQCKTALRLSAFGISLIPPVLISYCNPGLFLKASSKKETPILLPIYPYSKCSATLKLAYFLFFSGAVQPLRAGWE